MYAHVITNRLVPGLGAIRLQELTATDVKRYYTDSKLSFIDARAAARDSLRRPRAGLLEGLVTRNVAALVIGNRSSGATTTTCAVIAGTLTRRESSWQRRKRQARNRRRSMP